jgi:hypothetical protein
VLFLQNCCAARCRVTEEKLRDGACRHSYCGVHAVAYGNPVVAHMCILCTRLRGVSNYASVRLRE